MPRDATPQAAVPACGLILKMEVRDAAHRTQTEHSQTSKAHVRGRAQWTARYDPNRHLPVLLGGSYHKSKTGQLDCLLDTEEIYNRLRKEKRAEYSPARHICYLIAILAEYSSLKNS